MGFLTGYVLKKYFGSFLFIKCPLSVCIYTITYFNLISTTFAEEIAEKELRYKLSFLIFDDTVHVVFTECNHVGGAIVLFFANVNFAVIWIQYWGVIS